MVESLSPEYIAGFFDGEGSIAISRVGKRYHKITLVITQRADRREVLDRICAEHGGAIVSSFRHNLNPKWGDVARWQLQDRNGIDQFLATIEDFVVVKSAVVDITRAFLSTLQEAARPIRGHGRMPRTLTDETVEIREIFRHALRNANQCGQYRPPLTPSLRMAN